MRSYRREREVIGEKREGVGVIIKSYRREREGVGTIGLD